MMLLCFELNNLLYYNQEAASFHIEFQKHIATKINSVFYPPRKGALFYRQIAARALPVTGTPNKQVKL